MCAAICRPQNIRRRRVAIPSSTGSPHLTQPRSSKESRGVKDDLAGRAGPVRVELDPAESRRR
jgi:hypothetical protein